MIARIDCGVAERLAGSIALGEAGEAQRDAYRRHIAQCRRCLGELGGEREIERTMRAVTRARDDESWEPDLRAALSRRRRPRAAWLWIATLVVAIAAILTVRLWPAPQRVPPSAAISAHEARAIAALGTQRAPRREVRAESLSLGGIARSAQIELSVDSRGTPVRCTIARSSGDRALDGSICRAAMRQKYTK